MGRQAPAVLTERKSSAIHGIGEFKKHFGLGKKRGEPLSENQINDRRQTQLKALLATA